MKRYTKLGEILLDAGIIDKTQLALGLEYKDVYGIRLGEALSRLGFATEDEILQAISKQTGIPIAKTEQISNDVELKRLFSFDFLKNHLFFPLSLVDDVLTIAVSEPYNILLEDEIKKKMDVSIKMNLMKEKDIVTLIDKIQHKENTPSPNGYTQLIVKLEDGINEEQRKKIIETISNTRGVAAVFRVNNAI